MAEKRAFGQRRGRSPYRFLMINRDVSGIDAGVPSHRTPLASS